MTAAAGGASTDDKALMLEFQERGDVAAFEELFRRHRLPLFRYLRGLSRCAEVAEEISQHAWLKVVEAARAARYNTSAPSSFKTWLYTLARHHFIDTQLRAHASTRTVSNSEEFLMEVIEDGEPLDRRVDLERLGGVLGCAIGLLPLEQREVVLLWAHGHELKVIAEITGVSWDTAASRKKYALAKLRGALAAVGVAQGDM